MNIVAFKSLKEYWDQQTDGHLGPGGKPDWNYSLEAKELIMFLDSSKKYTCLELGCGNGALYSEMKQYYSQYTGVDFSASNLKTFQEKHTDTHLICSDVLKFDTDKNLSLYIQTIWFNISRWPR